MKKRIATLLMALVMLMSVLPLSAFTDKKEDTAADKTLAAETDIDATAVDKDDAYEIDDDVELSYDVKGSSVRVVVTGRLPGRQSARQRRGGAVSCFNRKERHGAV